MSDLPEPADPGAHGLDATRLARAGDYLGRYVDEGKLAGWQLVVARGGAVVWHECRGLADVEAGTPVRPDMLWRLHSMTKPVTAVAAMMLYEDGAFALDDPVARWLPEFASPRVYQFGPPRAPGTAPASPGTGFWSGAANTEFFADPAEGLAATLFTQMMPYGALPLQRELAQLVYVALTGQPVRLAR